MTGALPLTPLLEQYEGVKARYPGHVVLFRVGDFYETFGDDAKLLSRELDVVLTARAPDSRGDRTPMAGVPYHAVETYLGRLVRKGYKVALCDQVEDARVAKGLVRREVTRVVTPGTVVEDRLLGGPDHSFLASVVEAAAGPGGYAAVDVTTGEWFHGPADAPGAEGITSALAPFHPREILFAARPGAGSLLEGWLRREFPSARLESAPAPGPEASVPAPVREAVPPDPTVEEADRRLAAYLASAQPRLLPFVTVLERTAGGRRLVLDAKTLRHLEITRPMNPDDPRGPTLLDTWDETVTASGRRTLSFWLQNPLADPDAIADRQDAVEALRSQGAGLDDLRARLKPVGDLGRIASRIAGRRVQPPELGELRSSLEALVPLRATLGPAASASGRLEAIRGALEFPGAVLDRLRSALPEGAGSADGRRFRPGFSPQLDGPVEAERAAIRELAALERSEQDRTGIRSLKVGYNQVFGYYFEVSRPHLAKVPPEFRRKQTVAQGERYVSDRLDELERRILEARQSADDAEGSLWERFLGELDESVSALQRVGRAVGALDALATFAHLAQSRGYVRPTVDGSTEITVRDGRHPVLDRRMGDRFVPNDVELDAAGARLLVLTGPNMSGKSTYMRQVGLLVVLAQAGSPVPARFARIGAVTALFTRMGFTDEIGRGKSSFMVEMTEVAEILRSADERSLVLLDEVGRGTSTFDGLAIAWATLRYLHDRTRCRTILATHYHQLTALVESLPAARNAHLAAREGGEGVVFLHRLVPGSTDRSYGIHVARLAGVPPPVLEEADRLLRRLETEGVDLSTSRRKGVAPSRYTQAVLLTESGTAPEHPVVAELRTLDVDRLTPIDALQKLSDMRRKVAPAPPKEERP